MNEKILQNKKHGMSVLVITLTALIGALALTILGGIRLEMGDNVKLIGSRAFARCEQITVVEISDAVTDLAEEAFHECFALTRVVLPKSLRVIEDKAFESCGALVTVEVFDELNSVGNDVFKSCSSLKNVYYSLSKDEFAKIAFGEGNDAFVKAYEKRN